MSTRISMLALVAMAAAAISALVPARASAFGRAVGVTAPARVAASHPAWRGWGYGRGWCYWHPYACYRY